MEHHKFVFIGGLHRSGTTILHDCLTEHPEISGLSDTGVPMNEGQFLQPFYPPAKTKRKLWPIRYLRAVTPPRVSTRGYGGPGRFGFDPGSHLDESSPLVSPQNAEVIFDSWARYWDPTCPVLIEKSPPNIVRTRFLQALFPNSYFIILSRHPVSVSYSTRTWTKYRPMYFLFEHWLVCEERYRKDKSALNRTIEVRFEDFVRDPETVLHAIYDFLEVRREPLRREVSSAVNNRYFAKWNESQRRSVIARRYTKMLRNRFEDRFNRFGYTLGDPFLEGPEAGLAS